MARARKTRATVRRPAPTRQAYGELQKVYDLFNTQLFAGQLPHCLMTLQRKGKRTFGYFSHKRFASMSGEATDEIALNPMWFKHRDLMEALQTVAHEMCHLWQAHFGTPSRSGYHNREWAAKMQAIGLMPSDTGKPGGNTTGQHMGDYVIESGRFQAVATRLIASGFALTWHDTLEIEDQPVVLVLPGHGQAHKPRPKPSFSGKRRKYVCPQCQAAAWGRPELSLICGTCRRAMPPA